MNTTRALLVFAAGLIVGLLATQPSEPPLFGPGFAFAQQDLTAYSQEWEAITPSDTQTLSRQPRALFVCDEDGGTIDMSPWRAPNATPLSFPVSGGAIYPLSPGRVVESTTVECLIALY